jgi:hypothetical protein
MLIADSHQGHIDLRAGQARDADNKGDGDEHVDSDLSAPAVITSTAGHWYFCSEQ